MAEEREDRTTDRLTADPVLPHSAVEKERHQRKIFTFVTVLIAAILVILFLGRGVISKTQTEQTEGTTQGRVPAYDVIYDVSDPSLFCI